MRLLRATVLRHRDFRLLFWGQTASNFGSNAVVVAMAIYVTRSTGSAGDLGLILAAQTGPFVLLLLFGGVWADRLPRHRVMIGSDLVRAAIHGLLAGLILTRSARVWEIAAIEAVFGVAWAFFQPAETGLMPQTVPEDEIQQARALMAVSWNLSMVLGPALATVLVLTIGAGEAFIVDALSFVVSALTLVPVRPRLRGAATPPSQETLLHGLRSGFRELSARPWVWVTISCFSVVLMCFFAMWQALGPLVVRDVYGHVVCSASSPCCTAPVRWQARYWPPACAGGGRCATCWPARSCGRCRPCSSRSAPRAGSPRRCCCSRASRAACSSSSGRRRLPGTSRPARSHASAAMTGWARLRCCRVGYVAAGPLANAFGARTVLGVGGAIGMVAILMPLIPRTTRELTAEPLPAIASAE